MGISSANQHLITPQKEINGENRTVVLQLCLLVLHEAKPFLSALFELHEDLFELCLVSFQGTIIFL